MSKNLFDEFPKVSTKEWKQKINFDLKGKDYNETLIWKSPEGIDVKPFYDSQDLGTAINDHPHTPSNWKISQSIFVKDEIKSNHIAKHYLENGAESIYFLIGDEDINLEILLKDIEIGKHEIMFQILNARNTKQISSIQDFFSSHKVKSPLLGFDIISNFAESGNWEISQDKDWSDHQSYFARTKTISVDLGLYQNAGATMVQQLAYTLSHLNEYLFKLKNEKQLGDSTEITVFVRAAVASNYFFEISKLKSLRILVNSLSEFYAIPLRLKIHTEPSKRNKTIYDYNTNMIRTTIESMSAILGGSDFVENMAYDGLYHKKNEFGERISRNQLLILKLESGFDDIKNATDGAYYVESITQQLVLQSMELFKDLEKSGGFLQLLHNGKIQSKIEESANREQEEFETNEMRLVGANFHPNMQDYMKDELELYPFVKYKKRKTLIRPIIPRRLAERLEKERLTKEN